MGADFFYYRASVVNESCRSIFLDLTRLKELVLYPILSPKSFIEDVSKMTFPSLESLQLGIMNITVPDLKRIFNDVVSAFPNLESLHVNISYLSDQGLKAAPMI